MMEAASSITPRYLRRGVGASAIGASMDSPANLRLCSLRNDSSRFITFSVSCCRQHSQIVRTSQPSFFNCALFRASLVALPSNLGSQYSRFEDGIVDFEQPC